MEWLNGDLVWAVTEERQATYLFPRDCPRILLWPTPATTPADLEQWWGSRTCRMMAHIEWAWLDRLRETTLYRYELPSDSFSAVDDAWTRVSHEAITPLAMTPISDLLGALAAEGVELRVMHSLLPLRGVWDTSLHASGIRLRNAAGWPS
jgi:hypothetical protein